MSTIQLRRGTAAQWTSANPTLAAGEAGYETDTGKMKIGDGSTAWASLAYATVLPSDSRLSDARTPTAHTHGAADVTSGTLDIARIPTGTTSSTVALGNHNHSGVYAAASHNHSGSDITSGTVDVARLPTGTTSTNVLAPTIVDAAGDLIIGTGADTVARLATGTPGQILGTDGSGNKTAWVNRTGATHLPSGAIAETIPLGRVASTLVSNATTLSSGRLLLVGIELFSGQSITSISFTSGTTGISAATNWWFGLWDANRVCVGITADQGSAAWGTSTTKTLALAGGPVTVNSGLYYLGIMVAASTVPTLVCVAGATVIAQTAPVTCGTSNTGMTTPPSLGSTANALTGQANRPYAWVS